MIPRAAPERNVVIHPIMIYIEHCSHMYLKTQWSRYHRLTGILDTYEVDRETAIHAGCATGATTFKLAHHFNNVSQLDSINFIERISL